MKRVTTKRNYVGCVDQVMQFMNLDKYAKFCDMDKNARQDKLEEFVISKDHQSRVGTKVIINAVIKFLEMNRCILWKAPLFALMPEGGNKKAGGVPYLTEEIKMMLEMCVNIRGQAIIQFFTCTGARPGAIKDQDGYLTIGDLHPMPDKCGHIVIYKDTSEEYHGFLTPEGYDIIKEYLKWRESTGEILTDESPLFSTMQKNNLKPLGIKAINRVMGLIIKKAGIKRTLVNGHKYDKAQTYGFRKRLNGALKIDSDVNSNIAEKLLGHSVTIPMDNHYLTNDDPRVVTACFNEYRKVMKDIVINQEEKLRLENMKLRAESSLVTRDKVLQVFDLEEADMEGFTRFMEQTRKDRKFK